MDKIRVGLDFGTHQTKICIQKIPDEGHGQPMYEFFKFKDLSGTPQYVIPSLIQINEDDTLSYGYVDPSREKYGMAKPQKEVIHPIEVNIPELTEVLYEKYATSNNSPMDKSILASMLNIRKDKILQKQYLLEQQAQDKYISDLQEYNKRRNTFRYFKQATFADREWDKCLDSNYLCIWFISYILFLLEQKFDKNFSVNMGIPVDDKKYEDKKKNGVEILASAYHLVEDVYDGNLDAFLAEKVDVLIEKTKFINYSPDIKKEYGINIFPEAYAGLVCLTSKGKLSEGMSITADIGGGTTDISFFTIRDKEPLIYRYWSIPRGLNYIAENSGFDYSEGNFITNVNMSIVEKFNRKKMEIVSILIKDLITQLKRKTNISVSDLYKALQNRVLVYNGGGSTYDILACEINPFTDVNTINSTMWKEENVVNKSDVVNLCQLLSTAFGLSLCKSDNDVKLYEFASLFDGLHKSEHNGIEMVDKDSC